MIHLLQLSKTERDIYANLLNSAIEAMSNSSCNDCFIEVSSENFGEVIKLINEYTSDPHLKARLIDQAKNGKICFMDWSCLKLLKQKLEEL